MYALRRSAAAALRELVTCCRRNQLLLLDAAQADGYSKLMDVVLPGCGDQPTQVRNGSGQRCCVRCSTLNVPRRVGGSVCLQRPRAQYNVCARPVENTPTLCACSWNCLR
jgi:hypothetical protein